MSNSKPYFWGNLRPDIQKATDLLIGKKDYMGAWHYISIAGYVIALSLVAFVLLPNKLALDNLDFNDFIMFSIAGCIAIFIGKIDKQPKENYEKAKKDLKDKLIIKPCKCLGYCECKEKLVNYLDVEKGIKLFD